jgi:hypothetical protein
MPRRVGTGRVAGAEDAGVSRAPGGDQCLDDIEANQRLVSQENQRGSHVRLSGLPALQGREAELQ